MLGAIFSIMLQQMTTFNNAFSKMRQNFTQIATALDIDSFRAQNELFK